MRIGKTELRIYTAAESRSLRADGITYTFLEIHNSETRNLGASKMDYRLAVFAIFGMVSAVKCSLQVSPRSLLLPHPAGVTQRQEMPSATFTCLEVEEGSTPGRPRSNVVWMKNGEVIVTENNKKYRHYRKKKKLRVYRLTYDDQGTYQCGFSEEDTQLGTAELWIAPMITEAPLLQTVRVGRGRGEEVMVRCAVRGLNYTIAWKLKGVVIASTNETNLNSRYAIQSNGSLQIQGGNQGDSGCYSCTVGNKAGNSSANIQLIVTVNDRPTTAAIKASQCSSQDTTTVLPPNSNTTSSSCHVIEDSDTDSCKVLEDISFTDDEDSSDIGMAGTLSEDEQFSPVFLQPPWPCVQTTVGYTVDIVCAATGNPTPTVWWVKDNVTITGPQAVADAGSSYHYQQLPDNALRVHSVHLSDTGSYQCVAENTQGRHSAVTTVRVWGVGDVCGCVKGATGEGGRVRRITEGTQVTSSEDIPWQVLIEYHRNFHSDKLCGGTLLRPDWLLTAAHCLHAGSHWLSPSDLVIRVGVVNRSISEPAQQYLEADRILPHPEYNTSFQYLVNKVPEYDIALIRLRHPARLTDSVQPACLPDVNSDPPVGTMCRVSGWGHLNFQQGPSPPVLHHTRVPLVNYSNCRHEDSYGNAVTRKHLCAGFHEGGPDACQNDSGGPLVCERGGRWTLFGVINHGIGCGQEKKYGLYARVVRYNSWIKRVLAIQL